MEEPKQRIPGQDDETEKLSEDEVIRRHRAIEREKLSNPKLCSNCTGPLTGRGFYVEEEKSRLKIYLCSLRCQAIYSMTRGWAK